jgi:hypothetical protein
VAKGSPSRRFAPNFPHGAVGNFWTAILVQNSHPPCRQFRLQAFPILCGQARETFDLLNQKNVSRMRVSKQSKQLRAGELRAAFVFRVPGGDGKAPLGGEGPELLARTLKQMFPLSIVQRTDNFLFLFTFFELGAWS